MPPRDSQLLFRRNDLRRAIRAVQDLGLPIERIEIGQDGGFVIIPGTPAQQQAAAGTAAWDKATEEMKAKAKSSPPKRAKRRGAA
jgi:hypothetical protein